MSINKNVGALKKSFAKLRTSSKYINTRDNVKEYLNQSKVGTILQQQIHNFKDSVKKGIIDSGIFKEFEIDYIGPVNGHDINALVKAFNAAKRKDGPCVVHVMTKKGKGYKYTEEDRDGLWHGVPGFEIETGKILSTKKEGYKDYSSIVADALDPLMEQNKEIVCLTPAMITGSKLNNLFNKYPDRCFDCGIAEDHTICFASGLALSGKRPFVSIYSSFLQRAYDQLNHDVARMNLPIVFGIDRAGLVGEDGVSHHGVFDISFIRSLPNVIIAEGKSSIEIENLLYTAFKQNKPFFLRYPRGNTEYVKTYRKTELTIGKWEKIVNNISRNKTNKLKAYIISYGEDVMKLSEYIKIHNLPYGVINARFIKPIDTHMLDELFKSMLPLYLYTTDIIKGGLGDDILEYANLKGYLRPIKVFGIDDEFVAHGSLERLKKSLKLNIQYIFSYINKELHVKESKH